MNRVNVDAPKMLVGSNVWSRKSCDPQNLLLTEKWLGSWRKMTLQFANQVPVLLNFFIGSDPAND